MPVTQSRILNLLNAAITFYDFYRLCRGSSNEAIAAEVELEDQMKSSIEILHAEHVQFTSNAGRNRRALRYRNRLNRERARRMGYTEQQMRQQPVIEALRSDPNEEIWSDMVKPLRIDRGYVSSKQAGMHGQLMAEESISRSARYMRDKAREEYEAGMGRMDEIKDAYTEASEIVDGKSRLKQGYYWVDPITLDYDEKRTEWDGRQWNEPN